MRNNNRSDLSAAFAALRQRFEQGLAGRAEAMLILATEQKTVGLKSLSAEAHKLAGACGTFGYTELGLLARQIEQLVKTISGKPAAEQIHVAAAKTSRDRFSCCSLRCSCQASTSR